MLGFVFYGDNKFFSPYSEFRVCNQMTAVSYRLHTLFLWVNFCPLRLHHYFSRLCAQFLYVVKAIKSRKSTNKVSIIFQAGVISELYALPEPLKHSSCSTSSVTIEGYLDKLPSGKKKSTFWNAWKRRYFRAKDGFLYCYQVRKTRIKNCQHQIY